MTTEEFSNEFDVLLNSYSSGGIEFNEYEKSIFLTKAQEDLLVELYNGKNPFRGPGYRRVLRLDIDNGIAEIVSKYNISRYLVRYLSKPNPIILVALPAHLNINGESKITECDLHPALHRVILDRAVGLAIASKGLDTNRTK